MWCRHNWKVAGACLCVTNFPILTFNFTSLPLAWLTHPAAIFKISKSSLLSVSCLLTHKVLSFLRNLCVSEFSWTMFYRRSQPLQQLASWQKATCYFFKWTPLQKFSENSSISKGVSMTTQIPRIPCCFGQEMLSGGDFQHGSGLPHPQNHSIGQCIGKSWVQVNGKTGSYLKKFYCFWKGWYWKMSSLSAKCHDAPWKFVYLMFSK